MSSSVIYRHPRPSGRPVLNVEALDETMEHIYTLVEKAAAEQGMALGSIPSGDLDDLSVPGWSQADWRLPHQLVSTEQGIKECGTAYCVAGWRAQQDGVWSDPKQRVYRAWSESQEASNPEETVYPAEYPDGILVEEHARLRFGLSEPEASVLFYSANTISDIALMHQALKDGKDITRTR